MKLRWLIDLHGEKCLQFNMNDRANNDDPQWHDVPKVWEDLRIGGGITLREDWEE